jgi:hypothetical protein
MTLVIKYWIQNFVDDKDQLLPDRTLITPLVIMIIYIEVSGKTREMIEVIIIISKNEAGYTLYSLSIQLSLLYC